MTILTTLGKALRMLRIEKDLTAVEMASKIGMKTNILTAIERGVLKAPDTLVSSICEQYDLTENEKQKLKEADMIDKQSTYVSIKNNKQVERCCDKIISILKDGDISEDIKKKIKQFANDILSIESNDKSTKVKKTCASCKHWVPQDKIPGFGYCVFATTVYEYEQSKYPQKPMEVVLKVDDHSTDIDIVTGENFNCVGWKSIFKKTRSN